MIVEQFHLYTASYLWIVLQGGRLKLLDMWECLDFANMCKGLEDYREDIVCSAEVVIYWV
jgi:hypothetical protein